MSHLNFWPMCETLSVIYHGPSQESTVFLNLDRTRMSLRWREMTDFTWVDKRARTILTESTWGRPTVRGPAVEWISLGRFHLRRIKMNYWIRINSFIWSIFRRLHLPDIPLPMILADEDLLLSGILLIQNITWTIYDTWNCRRLILTKFACNC